MKSILRALAVVFDVLFLCVVAVFAGLQTQFGKAWLAREVGQAPGDPDFTRRPLKLVAVVAQLGGLLWTCLDKQPRAEPRGNTASPGVQFSNSRRLTQVIPVFLIR